MYSGNFLNGIANRLFQHSHNIELILNESHLEIHLSQLREVPRGRAFFCTEYLRDSEHAFEGPHHYLLVKLWRSRKICCLVVIVIDFKYCRPTFSIASHERGCREFKKTLASKRFSICA